MKKILCLMTFIVMISCQKKEEKISESPTDKITDSLYVSNLETDNKILKTDTILVSKLNGKVASDFVLAHLLKKVYDKYNLAIVTFRIDFFKDKKRYASEKGTIKNFQEHSEWSADTLVIAGKKQMPFLQVNVGYPACSYLQEHYLFNTNKDNFQMIYHWNSLSDSGFGSWFEFSKVAGNDFFYGKYVSLSPMDDENDEEHAIVSFRDSTKFILKNNRWEHQLITKADQNYKVKTVALKDYLNSEK